MVTLGSGATRGCWGFPEDELLNLWGPLDPFDSCFLVTALLKLRGDTAQVSWIVLDTEGPWEKWGLCGQGQISTSFTS